MSRTRLSVALVGLAIALIGKLPAGLAQSAGSKPEPPPAVSAPSPDPLARFQAFKNAILLLYKDFSRFDDPDLVVIPIRQWDAYLKSELARLNQARTGAAITTLNLTGNLGEERAVLEAEIGVRSDQVDGANVDLALHEANLMEATSSSGQVPSLRREPGGNYTMRVDSAGVFQFKLRFFVEVDRGAGDSRLSLTLPAAPVKGVQLSSAEALLFARDLRSGKPWDLSADKRTVRPLLRADDSLQLAWRTVADRRTGRLAAASCTGVLSYRLNESTIETEAQLRIEARGDTREWSFLLPAGEQVRAVSADVQGRMLDPQAEVFAEERTSRLRVRFADPVVGQVKMRIVAERPRPANKQTFEIGRCELENAESQKGSILIYAGPDLSVKVTPKRGAQRIAPNQLEPQWQRDPPWRAFRYYLQPAALELEVETSQPVVTATLRTELVVSADKIDVQIPLRYSIRRAHTEKLTLHVPAEMTDLAASPSELVEIEGVRPIGTATKEVMLSLSDPRIGEVDVTIRGTIPLSPGSAERIVRLPTVMGDSEYPGTVAVREAANARLTANPDHTRNLIRQPLGSVEEPATAPLWLFRQRRGPAELAFIVERMPRALEVSIESEFRCLDEEVEVKSRFRYRARNEPIDDLRLRIPPGVIDPRWEGENLGPIPPGKGEITIPLRNPAETGELVVSYRVASREAGKATIPLVQTLGSKVLSYKGDIFTGPGILAAVDPPWESGPPVASRFLAGGELPSLVVRAKAPADNLEIRLEASATLTPVVISRAVIEEVVGLSRRYGHVRLLVSRHRVRSATLSLPAGCRLIDTLIDAAPAEVIQDARSYRITLPANERPFSLEIIYEVPLAKSPGALTPMELSVPTLGDGAAVEEVRWLLHAPSDRLLLCRSEETRGEMTWRLQGLVCVPATRETQADVVDWLMAGERSVRWSGTSLGSGNETGRLWTFAGRGNGAGLNLWSARESFWVLLCSGATLVTALAIGRASRQRRWRLAVVALVAMLAAFLFVPRFLAWFWFGAQWGMYLAAAWLLVRWLPWRRIRWPRFSQRHAAQLSPPLTRSPRLVSAALGTTAEVEVR